MSPERRHEGLEPPPFGEVGRLEYDPVEDALLCHVCGGHYHNLAQHARLTHHLGASEYRKVAGLNRQTPLVTPTMRERLREVAIPLIARLRTEGKLRRWDEDPNRWRECKEAAVQAVREGLRAEGSQHRRESWDPERRGERAEETRQRNLAGKLRATPEAIGEGLRRYYAEHPGAVAHERLKRMAKMPKATERTAREVVCPRCGQTFRAMSHREKYCPECRPLAAREQNARWRRAWRHARRDGSGE